MAPASKPVESKIRKKNVGSCKLKVIIKTPSTGAAQQTLGRVWREGCRGFARPPINVPTTGQRGVGSTEAESFGKDEGIDLSVEAVGNIFAHVLQAAKPAARASLVSTCRPIMKQD